MNRPDACELLVTARELLMDRVFPAIPEALHYEVRMIANAMGIAAREARQGEALEDKERALLAGLLEDPAAARSLTDARAVLAAAIRKGQFDPPGARRRQAEAMLLAVTHDALTISNPRAANPAPEPR